MSTFTGIDCSGRTQVLRIIPELRADHVKRDGQLVEAITLYFGENPDLVGTEVPNNFRKTSFLKAVVTLWRSQARALEMPEPLWIRFLPKNIALTTAYRLSSRFKRGQPTVVTYAIENNSLDSIIVGEHDWVRPAAAVLKYPIGLLISIGVDRIAYGSHGSSCAYTQLPFVRRVRSTVIPGLPGRPARTDSGSSVPDADMAMGAVFVGVLEERKGVRALMQAWSEVESARPRTSLTIVGSGPLQDEISAWVEQRPSSRKFLGRLPHDEVAAVLSRHQVLVAPSIRSGRWREQIGLPIIEALTKGLTVVASDETALASWLSASGHTVIPAEGLEQLLCVGIASALDGPLATATVIESLPEVPGRIAADRWLHADVDTEPTAGLNAEAEGAHSNVQSR